MTSFEVINPATEQVVRSVALTSADETDAAIVRAQAAFPVWRDVAPGDRARLLRRFADAVEADIEHLARLEVENSGHTIGNARWEAGNVRDVLNYYSAAPERLIGQQIPVPGGVNVTFHEPLGVVGVIVPWNFPMPIMRLGFAPALAMRQHRRAQARRTDPAHRDPARRAGARGAADPGRRLPGAARQGVRCRTTVRRPPGGAQGGLHRLHRGRQADHGRLRGAGEARDAGAGRQERERRLRRRRPGESRGDRALRRLRQRLPGLLRPVPDPGAGQRLRPVHGAAGTRRPRRRRRRSRRREHRDGAADLRRAPGEGRLVRAGRRARRVPRHRGRPGPASGSRRPS